ncbi:MAG: hypothetical protein ACKODL_06780, partial [Phenylobacterium sp.]
RIAAGLPLAEVLVTGHEEEPPGVLAPVNLRLFGEKEPENAGVEAGLEVRPSLCGQGQELIDSGGVDVEPVVDVDTAVGRPIMLRRTSRRGKAGPNRRDGALDPGRGQGGVASSSGKRARTVLEANPSKGEKTATGLTGARASLAAVCATASRSRPTVTSR